MDEYLKHILHELKKLKKKLKKEKKKRRRMKKKYRNCMETSYYLNEVTPIYQPEEQDNNKIPDELLLDIIKQPGLFFSFDSKYIPKKYIGMLQGEDGNIAVVGGNGSGKSSSIVKPTLMTWRGTICATDIKGELSSFYAELYQKGIVIRPFITFNPMQKNCISYDPFYWLLQDDDENLVSNIWEIVFALIPTVPEIKDPFWIETERSILVAALMYYFDLGASFNDTLYQVLTLTLTNLIDEILKSKNTAAKILIGQLAEMKPEALATFDRGLRNKLIPFVSDPRINNAFLSPRDGIEEVDYFSWDILETHNVFLCIPEDKIEQWSGAINLMYTQLIRYLERRPDKYSLEGKNNVQTLLLMDEFARFGKLEMFTNAISTLRSKSVNICLMIQSVAQLDKIYGKDDRRIIFDNCQYQAILRANDAETQKYISDLIGVQKGSLQGGSENLDEFMENTGYSKQINEIYRLAVFPHELSTLKDILLLTPYGFCRVEKCSIYKIMEDDRMRISSDKDDYVTIQAIATPVSKEEKTIEDDHMKISFEDDYVIIPAIATPVSKEEKAIEDDRMKISFEDDYVIIPAIATPVQKEEDL